MNSKRLAILAGVSAALLLPLTTTQAANNNPFGSKSVPGVCMVSRDAVISNSKVGEAADKRLNQLAQQEDNKLKGKHDPLQRDIDAFQKKAASLSDAQIQKQQQSLQQRMQQFDQQASEADARIHLTRDKVTKRILTALDPLIADVYKKHKCGILLDRDAVIGGNRSNDLTGDALKALDAKMSSISFNLEPLPKRNRGAQPQSHQ